MDTLPFLIGLVASALVIANSVPQAVKIWKTSSAVGVNVAMWILFFGLLCLWLGYGIRVGNLTLIIANVGTMITSGSVLLAITRSRGGSMLLAFAGLLGLTAVLVLFAMHGPIPILAVLFLLATGLTWLQTVTSFRTWRSGGPSSVSITAFALRAGANAGWILQCLITGDRLLLVVSAVTLSGALSTIVLEVLIARRQRVLA